MLIRCRGLVMSRTLGSIGAAPAMVDVTPFLPGLPPVQGKAVVARFDGGRLSSEGGLLALREIERRLGLADRLAGCLKDPRMPEKVVHHLAEIIRFRMLMIVAGYEDGNDADTLRRDPMFKLALDRLPSGDDLCSQSTISRLENLPDRRAVLRLGRALVDQYCGSLPGGAVLSAFCGGQASGRAEGRFAALCAASSAPSGPIGPRSKSCCALTVIMRPRKCSTGVGRTGSIGSSVWPPMQLSAATSWHWRKARPNASSWHRPAARCAAAPSSPMPPGAGAGSSASSPASKRGPKAPTPALLSPTSKAAAPSTSTSGCTAPAARPRTTSRRGRTTSPPTAPPAMRPRPTSFACSCTLAPIGSCGRCAASCPNVRLGELCSLIPCGYAWSNLLPVSSSSKPSSRSTCRRAPPIRRYLPCSSTACRVWSPE